jgi:hypothetical protein
MKFHLPTPVCNTPPNHIAKIKILQQNDDRRYPKKVATNLLRTLPAQDQTAFLIAVIYVGACTQRNTNS